MDGVIVERVAGRLSCFFNTCRIINLCRSNVTQEKVQSCRLVRNYIFLDFLHVICAR